ncbi:MAG: c-type cytochrome domain-containing protein [Planctomycetaceae bacterium]
MNKALLVALSVLCLASPCAAQTEPVVDFAAEVWPILRDRCVGCHGPGKQDGGLRVDSVEGLQQGGMSERDILGADSELIRRISLSELSGGRMPMDGPSLSADEIRAVDLWIRQGAVWSISTAAESRAIADETMLSRLTAWLKSTTRHVKWFFVVGLCLAAAILFLERRRKRLAADGGLMSLRRSHYGVAILTLILAAQWWHHRAAGLENERRIAELESRLLTLANPKTSTGGDAFGPVPRRPEHPPRLGGEYYRGNDERHERLFNRGFYRTATFDISLTDESGNRIDYDSPIPDGPVYLDFQMARSPGTSDGHYRDEAMHSIYLSRQANHAVAIDEPVQLEEVEPKWKWGARYRLSKAAITDQLQGRVFVHCSARVEGGLVKGHIHYAISYDLLRRGDRLAKESEVWMGSLFQTENVVGPPADKIPVDEWFDFRPIPEIVGKNTDDPKLLGLDNPDGNRQ